MSYSSKIKQFREGRGLNHQEFGDAVGVSRGSVQQWEKGTTAPTRKNQPVVAKFMGISVSELMADSSGLPPAGLVECLAYLAGYLEALDPSDRAEAVRMIQRLGSEPSAHAKVTQAIEGMTAATFANKDRKAA